MRKLITLLAATTLMASPFALAEGNPNDVLQQIPAHQATGAANTNDTITVADAGNAAQPSPAADMGQDTAKAAKMKHHGKKHHPKKRHAKKHHHKQKAKKAAKMQDATPVDNTTGPAPMETPAS